MITHCSGRCGAWIIQQLTKQRTWCNNVSARQLSLPLLALQVVLSTLKSFIYIECQNQFLPPSYSPWAWSVSVKGGGELLICLLSLMSGERGTTQLSQTKQTLNKENWVRNNENNFSGYMTFYVLLFVLYYKVLGFIRFIVTRNLKLLSSGNLSWSRVPLWLRSRGLMLWTPSGSETPRSQSDVGQSRSRRVLTYSC